MSQMSIIERLAVIAAGRHLDLADIVAADAKAEIERSWKALADVQAEIKKYGNEMDEVRAEIERLRGLKRRSVVARDLRTPKYRPRVVRSKKSYTRKGRKRDDQAK
jgi:hypothetical protein